MVDKEGFNELAQRIKGAGLVMSNVPKKTRDEFIKFAEEEFADNYASCFKYIWENFKFMNSHLNAIDAKLDNITNLVRNPENSKKVIKTMDGKIIRTMKGGEEHE